VDAIDQHPEKNYDHDQITVPNLPFTVAINLDENIYDNKKTSQDEYEQQQLSFNWS